MEYKKGDYKKWPQWKKERNKRTAIAYQTRNPAIVIYHILQRRADRKSNFSLAQFKEWYEKQNKICIYCSISNERHIELHPKILTKRLEIERMDNSKGYVFGNIAIACRTCNTLKGHRMTYEDMKIIGPIVRDLHEQIYESKYKSRFKIGVTIQGI